MSDLTLTVEKRIFAPLEQLYEAWLNPDVLKRFMRPAPDMPEPKVTATPIEGGEFEILMQVGDETVPHKGQYLTIEHPHSDEYLETDHPAKLVFSWDSPYTLEGSRVTLSFVKYGDRNTLVTLTQDRFPDEAARDGHTEGWSRILDNLAEVV